MVSSQRTAREQVIVNGVALLTAVDLSADAGQSVATAEIASALRLRFRNSLRIIAPRPAQIRPAQAHLGEVLDPLPAKRNRALWALTAQRRIIRALARSPRGVREVVVVRWSPVMIGACLWMAARHRPYVLLVRGMPGVNASGSGLVRRGMLMVLAAAVRRAHAVATALDLARETLVAEVGAGGPPIAVISNGVDTAKFEPIPKQLARTELGGLGYTDADLVIGYVGSVQPRHQLDQLFRGFAAARAQGLTARLLIVGSGRQMPALQLLARQLDIEDRVTFTGHVDHAVVPRYIAACDACYGAIAPSIPSNPIKCYEYLACARIPIVSAVPEFEFVAERGVGITLAGSEPEDVARALVTVAAMPPAERQDMGERGRRYVEQFASWKRIADFVAEVTGFDGEQPGALDRVAAAGIHVEDHGS